MNSSSIKNLLLILIFTVNIFLLIHLFIDAVNCLNSALHDKPEIHFLKLITDLLFGFFNKADVLSVTALDVAVDLVITDGIQKR